MHRTKFIYDETGKPIGRVDDLGRVFTMAGKESHSHIQTPLGPAVNKSHARREAHAQN